VFLDKFKLDTVAVQLQYAAAFEVWDSAGAVAKGMLGIWPDLQVLEGQPFQQTLKASCIQVQTGIKVSTVTVSGHTSLDQRTREQIAEAFKIWKTSLALDRLARISTRAIYAMGFDSLGDANAALHALNLARWPRGNMFDQSEKSAKNALELSYKFEDDASFSFLRLRTEENKYEVRLDPPFENQELKTVISRLVVDFDRGLLGSIDASKFRMDDWLKGFQHVLRRDVDKIVGALE
jgi:hypothetical protein